ncbi:low molecular weight phosphotyrosine phosphatase family protein [Lysobacter antibioticus]|uniref:low molecular weight protein-tyrosine-phosphatase n=1 Tax=Lysobacter antibioticus TaxID=84531 RepID=UPI0007170EEB|nr:low molecular weight protein-tyrosine-phosphatase [Lysobacter antibioticus]ALN62499.1 low molecular weight phosphotyrosine phosphatase family protein [Lysobacter antibioticus]
MRLLIVCLGNICRSPVAEGVLRARIAASSVAGQVELDSAGTGDWHVGQPPDRRSIANAAQHGVDISGLRARQLAASDYTEFDWLLCADRANLRDVRARAPRGARARSALLLDWCGLETEGEVPDPYTGGPAQFEHVFQLLDRAADGAIARLREELHLG